MNKRKNKVLTFLFALIPGGAHMYTGSMQIGGLYLSVFMAVVMLAFYLNSEILLLPAVVVWFYTFFDGWNLLEVNEEEFLRIQRGEFIHESPLFVSSEFLRSRKVRRISGTGLLLIGGTVLLRTALYDLDPWLCEVLSQAQYEMFYELVYDLPKLITAGVLICAGWALLKNKPEPIKEAIEDE